MHAQVRADEWTNQPRPNRSLVIRAVSARRIPGVASAIVGIAWRQRSQSIRREQMLLDNPENFRSPVVSYERVRQTYGENLIRPNARIGRAAIHYVIQATCLFI